jgi:hypothetical protein
MILGRSPAISGKAKKEIRQCIKKWKIHLWGGTTLFSIQDGLNDESRVNREVPLVGLPGKAG